MYATGLCAVISTWLHIWSLPKPRNINVF